MRKVFYVIKRCEGGASQTYEISDLSGKVFASRKRLRHANEVVLCLDRGNKPPSQNHQIIADLMAVRVKFCEGSVRPYRVVTCKGELPVRSFNAKWSALAWVEQYDKLREAKKLGTKKTDENKLLDSLIGKWLVLDDSVAYGDAIENAKCVFKAEKE